MCQKCIKIIKLKANIERIIDKFNGLEWLSAHIQTQKEKFVCPWENCFPPIDAYNKSWFHGNLERFINVMENMLRAHPIRMHYHRALHIYAKLRIMALCTHSALGLLFHCRYSVSHPKTMNHHNEKWFI